jgi:hypothetical protein
MSPRLTVFCDVMALPASVTGPPTALVVSGTSRRIALTRSIHPEFTLSARLLRAAATALSTATCSSRDSPLPRATILFSSGGILVNQSGGWTRGARGKGDLDRPGVCAEHRDTIMALIMIPRSACRKAYVHLTIMMRPSLLLTQYSTYQPFKDITGRTRKMSHPELAAKMQYSARCAGCQQPGRSPEKTSRKSTGTDPLIFRNKNRIFD